MINEFIKIVLIPSLFLSVIVVQYQLLQSANIQIAQLETQITTLKAQSDIAQARYNEAQKQAEIEIKKSHDQVNEIMSAKVPKKCDAAISWGIDQAKRFHA